MRVGVIMACLAALVGCSKDGESGVTLKRSGDEPAVVEVEGSAQLDLGAAKEVEPNNDNAAATPIELPVAVTGVLSGSDDVDVFSFTPTVSGIARVHLRPLEGADLMIESRSNGGKTLRVADRGPDTAEGIPNLPVVKGKATFIAVKEFRKKSKGVRTGDSPAYQLEISIEPLPKASELERRENEPNDSAAAAKSVLSGDRPTAFIGWDGDIDYYKLSLEGFTEADLVEISLDAIDGVTLSLELSGDSGENVLSRRGTKSGPLYVRGLSAGGANYLIAKVSAKRSHEAQRYRFHFATRRKGDDDEVEPNDDAKTATSLGSEDDDSGEARAEIFGADVDWFALPTSSNNRVVNATLDAGGAKVSVEAIAGGETLGSFGSERSDIELTVPPKMRLRFKVTVKGAGEPAQYGLSWRASDVAAAPEPEPEPASDPSLLLE